MSAPNPHVASKEKVLNFIDKNEYSTIKQVHDKFKEMDLDFGGMEKYYLQKINHDFNFLKAMKECYPENYSIPIREILKKEVPKNVNFNHFKEKNIPSKKQQSDSKIPSKYYKPNFDIENKSHFFYQKKVVISGTFEMFPYRAEIAKILWEVGADVDAVVTENTNILIAGDGVGWKKIEIAEKFGIYIMDIVEFLSNFPEYNLTFKN